MEISVGESNEAYYLMNKGLLFPVLLISLFSKMSRKNEEFKLLLAKRIGSHFYNKDDGKF